MRAYGVNPIRKSPFEVPKRWQCLDYEKGGNSRQKNEVLPYFFNFFYFPFF